MQLTTKQATPVQNLYFVSMLVHFDLPSRNYRFRPTSGIKAHAAVIKAISALDREAGFWLHETKRNKPMSLAFLDNRLRLTFTGKDSLHYAEILSQYWQANPSLCLGNEEIGVKDVELGGSNRSGIQTWNDICQPTRYRHLHFHFLSPTAFTKQDMRRRRYSTFLPDSVQVFQNLAHRWQNLEGPTLPDSLINYLDDGGCVINEYKIRTTSFKDGNRTQIGFIGNVTYLIRNSEPEQILALNQLTRLAPFVGIGYQVARGMGAVSTKLS